MVKFSKQFEAQLVPEWKDAFVDYWQLKKEIKKIQRQRQQAAERADQADGPGLFNFDRFSRITNFIKKKACHCLGRDLEPKLIQVRKPEEDVYETEVIKGQFDQSDAAQVFFSTLDTQLNKVNQFYRTKEKEFLERGDALKEQLVILKGLKASLTERKEKESSHGGESENNSTHYVASTDDCRDDSIREPAEDGDLEDKQETAQLEEEGIIGFENNVARLVESPRKRSMDGIRSKKNSDKHLSKIKSNPRSRSFSSHGRSMRMDIPLTTPRRTFSALTHVLWDDLMNQQNKDTPEGNRFMLNKKNLHRAEKLIRGALVELYRGLGFLNTYRSLNMLAFEKILKKFDKLTGKQQILPIYFNVVERSYFNTSDKVVKLSDEIEELFVQYFAVDDRRKAMTYLKPKQSKVSHTVTFFIGLFTGCFLALFVGYIIMAHLAKPYLSSNMATNMATSYQVFSLINLHIFLYGCNIFMWRRHRINYIFIFEFARKRELKYQDVFLICTTFMTIVAGCMVAQLALREKRVSSIQVDTIPGLLLLASMIVLLCPLNIIYRSTRFTFLRVLRNIVLSPFYKVVMVDFFMADQLTSQVPLLRQLEYVTCYYASGSYKTENSHICRDDKNYRDLVYVVSFLPYYWRAMQCARRWFDEGDINHIANLGKYVSAMVAAGARLTHERQHTAGWRAMVVITSTIATIYQLYWDFVKDWGLLQRHSRNPWLRDELILKHKIIYFLAMALNLVLRLAWLQTIVPSLFGTNDQHVMFFLLASLEVIRRGHWNFYRLENEHLNNVGKYRAVTTVPLPFREVDED